MSKIKLGQKVQHLVTKVEGIAVSRTEYLSGCAHIGIQAPLDKDGKVPSVYYANEPMIIVIGETEIKPPEEPKDKSGPQDDPPNVQ